METTFKSAKEIINAMISKNRRTIQLPYSVKEIEVELRIDTEYSIEFNVGKIDLRNSQMRIERNGCGNELLIAYSEWGVRYNITAIESNTHKMIMDEIEKLKPLSRKLK